MTFISGSISWRPKRYGLNMERIAPEDSAAATKIPVLLIHGQIDSNIPVRHSRLIHARAPNAQLWEVPGADHCGAVSTAPQEFEKRLLGWFRTRAPEQMTTTAVPDAISK